MGRNTSSAIRSLKSIVFASFIALIFAFSSCKTTEQINTIALPYFSQDEVQWQSIDDTPFAQYFVFEKKDFPPLKYAVVKIDLANSNLVIKTYPNETTQRENGYIKGISIASAFKRIQGTIEAKSVLINTTPYTSHGSLLDKKLLHSKLKPLGLLEINTHRFSVPQFRYAMLVLSEGETGYHAKILSHQADIYEDTNEKAEFCIGGYFVVLKDGKLFDSSGRNFSYTSKNARTALGLSKDGKTLYILAAEGKKKSTGLTYPECAKILLSLGASDAMEFDGGGSSSILINGENPLNTLSKRKNVSYIAFLFCNKVHFN